MNKIGVVIPAYNEFENIEILVKLILKEIKCQIIVVDDSTNDKTKIIVKKISKSLAEKNSKLFTTFAN
jgi:glycosyltransferase involved in cell wall biosynthesis